MKIEKINENMIKVTVSLNDLEERNIDLNALNYNSPAAQELFWDMMEQAEEQYGFNMSDSQLVIEPIPDSTDGFIITITKMDEDGDFESIQKYIKSKLKKSDLKVKRRSRKVMATIMILGFNDIDDACLLSKRIANIYSGESSLFKCKDTYYLVMTKSNIITPETGSLEIMLAEYGRRILNTSFFEGYLNEYGEKIIENNALEVLRKYF
ncbi:MAG: adaptor protein MecA [Clostridiales bacterium]|nr:adaptor protein MecA [Clostridiales bacterium]